MSATLVGLIWDLTVAPQHKLVLLACAAHPGATRARVGMVTGLPPRLVQEAITALGRLGLLHEGQEGGPLRIDARALVALARGKP